MLSLSLHLRSFISISYFTLVFFFFFFNDTATTEIYTLSLHDALPISQAVNDQRGRLQLRLQPPRRELLALLDRKSTRLNSSHGSISYAVFCLKKKKKKQKIKINKIMMTICRCNTQRKQQSKI